MGDCRTRRASRSTEMLGRRLGNRKRLPQRARLDVVPQIDALVMQGRADRPAVQKNGQKSKAQAEKLQATASRGAPGGDHNKRCTGNAKVE